MRILIFKLETLEIRLVISEASLRGCMESMRQRKGPLSKPRNGRDPKAEHALYPESKNERQREERRERRLVLKGLGF